MKYFISHLILIFALSLNVSSAIKVLGVFPYDSTSHFKIGEAIIKALAEFSHNVTVISPRPQKQELNFFKDVSIADGGNELAYGEAKAPWFLEFLNFPKLPIFGGMKFLYESGEDTVNYVMTHPNVIELMESGKTFDACIIENTHFEALLGLAEVFKCVLITYTTYPSVHLVDRMTSNQSPMSYVPNAFLDSTTKMNFEQRFWNVLNTLAEKLFHEFFHLPNQKRLYEKYFPNAENSFENVLKNSSIVFINRQVNSYGATPRLPNMIDIGGIHVQQKKALKKKFKNFMDRAKEGAIIFSMGSIVQGVDWEDSQRETFVRAFARLKQKVIWKYENETLPNKPDNVLISKWIPQRNLLAHENVKLLITHGGLLSLFEAEVEGTPILGIPSFGDQHMNIANAVRRGFGLKLEEITEDNIFAAINEILSNEKFKENAMKASNEFKDRPMTPKLSVVYWTDYAIKHKGARHLRPAGIDLNYIEFNLLDVYLLIFTLIAAALVGGVLSCRLIVRKIFKIKKIDKKKKKN